MNQPFVHLRVHSEFSLSDGMVRIEPLVRAVADAGMPAIAVSDRCNLFALVKLQHAAVEQGLKPIVATDVMVQHGNEVSALTLIARNERGYRNLSDLVSRAYLEGQQADGVRLQREWIAEASEGLIALSGGMHGDVGKALLADNRGLASTLLVQWMSLFPNSFYLELQRTFRPGEEDYLHRAVALAQATDCPVVATNDVAFLYRDEFEAHEARTCIHEGRTLDDPRREHRHSEHQYLKSPEEMTELFADIPEAIENTVEIARRCNVDIDLGNYYLPDYPIPEGKTIEEYLSDVSRQGLNMRLKQLSAARGVDDMTHFRAAYDERLEYELSVINNMGFPGYFLIVMEFIQWAKENGIPVGPGRGSGAGSLVAYSLQITNIDPLEYDLLFERFLNPERVSLPDFDIDFCMDRRDEVIAHVSERYGRDAVSQIITFGTMAAKAVVRDVARVQGKPYGLADRLSKMIPFEPGMTLTRALEEEPRLKEFIDTNEDADEIMEMAFKLEGLARNVGKHAGGVVIAPTQITDYSPVYCDETGGNLMTQLNMIDVEQVGLVKFDFLGLRTLTIIDNAVKAISDRHGVDIDIDTLPLEDPAIYDDLCKAKTTAVFQLESRGMKDLMKKVKPNRFADIVALVALFRPGPMQLADSFINRKHGVEEVDYLHPDLQPVLEETYGVMLYQEQVMKIAQILAGYSLAAADILRKAMGKKKQEEMDKQRETFVNGAVGRGVNGVQADHIFDLMAKFAGYGFNKPHSVAYALVAYQTAWLKHYYPAEFMAAVMSADMHTTDKVVTNIEECRRELGIEVEAPDINRGEYRFYASSKDRIVYGLGAIKGLGEGAIEALVASREEEGAFMTLFDLCQRVDGRKINKRSIDALTDCGAMDALVPAVNAGSSDDSPSVPKELVRPLLLANRDDALKMAEQKFQNELSGTDDLFGEVSLEEESGEDRYHYLDRIKPYPLKDRIHREKDVLGLFLTAHPMDPYDTEIRHLVDTRIIDLRASREAQTVAGCIVGLRTMKSRKGESMAFVTLDDKSGRVEVSVFSDLYDQNYTKLQKDELIIVRGTTSEDAFSGGQKLRAGEIFSLAEARSRSIRQIRLNLSSHQLSQDFTRQLAELLGPYKGTMGAGCPVTIAYECSDAIAEVSLGHDWRVRPEDDLLQDLRDLYGTERAQFVY